MKIEPPPFDWSRLEEVVAEKVGEVRRELGEATKHRDASSKTLQSAVEELGKQMEDVHSRVEEVARSGNQQVRRTKLNELKSYFKVALILPKLPMFLLLHFLSF